ncbi:hypothetical protein HanRHA438_Chr17g0837631 [Helianthus annuus]|nr:hypothetical protein HanRHA438_Chr17g0837631 [Helianthus annuus]
MQILTRVRSPSVEYRLRISRMYLYFVSRETSRRFGGKYRSRELKSRGVNSIPRSS